MYDAIVVGARCAGAATALLLARRGHRVLILDRAAFPSDTLSGHAIRIPGVALLEKWGVLAEILAAGTPPIRTTTLDFGSVVLSGSPPGIDGTDALLAPRRTIVDAILLEAAARAGAEVGEGTTVTGLLWDGDRVTGVRAQRNGREIEERARIVAGADGMRSTVARLTGARTRDFRATRTCAYYSFWSGVPVSGAELTIREDSFVVALPTNDGLTNVAILRPRSMFDRIRHDVERSFDEALEVAPSLAERVRGGERVERFYGSAELPFVLRESHGPGWALVGDAGCMKDPILAQGMADAYTSAEFLAEAIDAALGGEISLEGALARYEERRDAQVAPLYEFAYELAALAAPPPEMSALLATLAGDQHETNRFLGVVEGTVPFAEFFAPSNIERIVGAVA